MRLTRLIATVSVTAAACVGLSAAYAAPSIQTAPMAPQSYTTQADAHENVILQRVNQLRANLGLQPLVRVQELDDIAQNWSEHMAYAGTISHRPQFFDYYPTGATTGGENVASRQYESEPDIGDKLYEQWENSPGHYANMVEPEINTIGIGLTYDPSHDKWYATQNFGAYPNLSNLTVTGTSTPSAAESVQPAPAAPEQPAAPSTEPPAATVEIAPEVTVEEAQVAQAPKAAPAPQKVEPQKTEKVTPAPVASTPQQEFTAPESPRQLAPETTEESSLPETGLQGWIPGSAVISFLMGSLFLVIKRKYALG